MACLYGEGSFADGTWKFLNTLMSFRKAEEVRIGLGIAFPSRRKSKKAWIPSGLFWKPEELYDSMKAEHKQYILLCRLTLNGGRRPETVFEF